jgi:hypothetical protein
MPTIAAPRAFVSGRREKKWRTQQFMRALLPAFRSSRFFAFDARAFAARRICRNLSAAFANLPTSTAQ